MERSLAWKRYSLRPGLLSLWWLRKRANMAFDSEVSFDVQYVESQSLWGDLGIAARSIPASLFSGEPGEVPSQIHFCGIRIDNFTMAEAATQIVELAQGGTPAQVCFVNAA
jgi:N-acetylglucosaminyldiphosphoundecaprenol N-acetyl-beta-D-mannosaminyltransferase